jgi:hypothetical protein
MSKTTQDHTRCTSVEFDSSNITAKKSDKTNLTQSSKSINQPNLRIINENIKENRDHAHMAVFFMNFFYYYINDNGKLFIIKGLKKIHEKQMVHCDLHF